MILGLFYVIVPLLLIGLIAVKRAPNILLWMVTIVSFGSVIVYMWASARWEIVSIYFRSIFLVAFVVAALFSYTRIKKPETPPKKIVTVFSVGLHLLLIVFFSGLNWFSFRGYLTPENSIDVVSPFRSGKQIVLHGGASPFINGHFHVKPQNYALDIVGLNTVGMRASSISGGSNLDDYVIYGASVYSPINGIITVVVDEYDDLTPPNTDTEHLAGNHVLIKGEGVEVLLAHLKKGSVSVKVGTMVTTNTLIGNVGNTGNTSEPHLHMHIEKDGEPNTVLDGNAVAFTINNRFLVRGDILAFEGD